MTKLTNETKRPITLLTGQTIEPGETMELAMDVFNNNFPWINGEINRGSLRVGVPGAKPSEAKPVKKPTEQPGTFKTGKGTDSG